MSRFIAIDPSTKVTGWAVFQDEGLVSWGKINVGQVQYSFRFQFVVNELIHLIQVYQFNDVVVEDVKFAWHSKNRPRQIAGLQVVFRSIQEWTKEYGIPFHAYNPATWKNSVVGAYTAPKEIVKNNIILRFPRIPQDLTEHEYDAIGIGVHHAAVMGIANLGE